MSPHLQHLRPRFHGSPLRAMLLLPLTRSRGFAASSSTPAVLPSSKNAGKKERHWSGVFLFLPGLATFGLGCWQLKRREWKLDLHEYQRSRLKDDILPLDVALNSVDGGAAQNNHPEKISDNSLQSLEYKRVQCEGVYDEDKSIFLGPRGRTKHGVTERGYYLITPLIPVESSNTIFQVPVLVNRGWVPGTWRDNPPTQKHDKKKEPLAEPANVNVKNSGLSALFAGKKHGTVEVHKPELETVKVVGVIRASEKPNMFVPPNEPSSGQWFFIDIPAMLSHAKLPENTLYIEALQENSETFQGQHYPIPKDPEALISSSVMPRDHLSYAITWFTLSAATTFMAWKRLSK